MGWRWALISTIYWESRRILTATFPFCCIMTSWSKQIHILARFKTRAIFNHVLMLYHNATVCTYFSCSFVSTLRSGQTRWPSRTSLSTGRPRHTARTSSALGHLIRRPRLESHLMEPFFRRRYHTSWEVYKCKKSRTFKFRLLGRYN